ncbi:MAG: hypothetical protein IJM81_11040 [Prevotella sp.]|nr:hypothetical protein [Prevotella sp.]
MKVKLLLAAFSTLLLTGCISGLPQYRHAPEGPLQEFFYQTHLYQMPERPYIYVHLWREAGNSNGGLLVYDESEPVNMSYRTPEDAPQWQEPQPVRVSEEVFTTVYNLIKEKRLYRMEKTYSTFIKDILVYSPWEMTIVFPGKTVHTTSDGTYAKHFNHDDFRAPMKYLKEVAGSR